MSKDVKALIDYYAQVGYYQHIQTVCEEVIRKRGNDPVLVFWRAFGAAMEGQTPEAIRLLEGLKHKRDVALPVTMALIYYHKQAALVDEEAVSELLGSMSQHESRSGEVGLLLAARFAWHVKNPSKARKLVQQVLASNSENPRALTLRGWINLTVTGTSRRDIDTVNKSIEFFDRALDATKTKPELEALMGAAKFWQMKKEHNKALDYLSKATVHYSWFLPGFGQKSVVLMEMGEWDSAMEVAGRVMEQDPFDILTLCVSILHNLTREARPSIATSKLSELVDALDRFESKNPDLYYNMARPFARLAGGNKGILNLTHTLVKRAQTLSPANVAYANEAAYQLGLMGNYQQAKKLYMEASKLDEGSVEALQGTTYCQIQLGDLEDAEQQLEFMAVIQQSVGRTATLAMLDALLAWRRHRKAAKQRKFLSEALRLHHEELMQVEASPATTTFDWFTAFNPQFLLEIAKEHLDHCGVEPDDAAQPPSEDLVMAKDLLSRVVKRVPGMLNAQLLLARVMFLSHEFDKASRHISHCLRLDSAFSAAHLLSAQIALFQDNFGACNQSLQQALSHNFEIRNSPVYHLVKARCLEASGHLEEAIGVLEEAMKVPGVKTVVRSTGRGAGAGAGMGAGAGASLSTSGTAPVSQHDRCSIFIKLAELHTRLGHIPEATKLVQDAMHEFTGTAEEVRVIVANSEISLKRGDVDAAVHMLTSVPSSSSSYAKAQMVKADIYLKHRKDKRLYVQCYKELVRTSPSEHSHVLLGEAYMQIQCPEEAIAAFETALSKNPSDVALATKIGKALVSTHDYLRAIEYYEAALKRTPNNTGLRSDLTELYIRLKKFEEASQLLTVALEEGASEDSASLMNTVKNLRLLYRVYKGTNKVGKAVDALQRSLQAQTRVLAKLRAESPDMLREQRAVAADISYDLAQLLEGERQDNKAKSYYHQALKAHNSHEASMLALARMYLRQGEVDACQAQCITLMRVDPTNEEASMMLADLMFRKNESDAAMYHFQQLLEKKPDHYSALSKLISLLKRAGKLAEVPRFLKLAERSSPRASHDPGLRFCKGLHYRYTNDPHAAIKEFNMVRHSGEWGAQATEHMVEIYLAPENQDIWEEVDGKEGTSAESLAVADKLLREIPSRPLTRKQQVLECYVLIASKNKGNIEVAQKRLAEMLQEDRDDIQALLALCVSLMVQKLVPKARNQLKRIAKMQYQQEFTDEFVRAWLMLAEIYITSSKYDMAQDLCKRCLTYDKSCARAWEHMGLIMEKEQSYKDAADHYEQAWLFQNESSATIGYKLAFNYLKAKRYVEAINVCHKVLKAFPDYPRIRKEILAVARKSLRP